MNTQLVLVAIVAVAVIVAASVVWSMLRSRRRQGLRTRFGPEYGHVVEETGSQRKAAAVLEERQRRVDELDIRPLAPNEADGFAAEWRAVQAGFVENPQLATAKADDLVGRVMHTRGYPVTDFEQRAADISVAHPKLVEDYRSGHQIALRAGQGEASTEDLRQAVIHYRSLFDDLLLPETTPGTPTGAGGTRRAS